ncbi:MAG: gamma-butyrobetaine hydroxylase-like domain-containing protein [Burkholderiales bacterium]
MAGLNKTVPQPTAITLHQASRLLEISFADGKTFRLTCEFLRVFSPSAEVRGHGPGQEVLQTGKQDVTITAVEPVGQYAIQLRFSDGHDTGIYSWDLIYDYGLNQESMWQQYLQRLQEAGASREKQ